MSDLDINRLNVGTAIIERTRRTLGVGAARQLWPMLGLPDLGGAGEPPQPQGATAFDFEGGTVRTVTINGVTWFVGKDVAERLGYTNTADSIARHCKGVVKRYPLSTPGGSQEVRVLSEADVLRLIVASKLPAAERFERWIFEVVLPEIRRTGSFRAGGGVHTMDTLDTKGVGNPDTLSSATLSGAKGVVKRHPHSSLRPVSPAKAADARFLQAVELFVRDCCVVSAEDEIQALPLYLAYDAWEARRGKRPMSQTRFGRTMRHAGYQKTKLREIYYYGLRLRPGMAVRPA